MKFTQDSLKALGLTTGDLILFSGSSVYSQTIKYATQSKWSHIGMVLKRTDDSLWFFESTESTAHSGVQINPLDSVLNGYEGDIAIRLLAIPLVDMQIRILNNFIRYYLGRPYEEHPVELICAALRCNPRRNLTSFFCSELIAEAYQQMRIISSEIPSNNFTPADFSSTSRYLRLKGTDILGQEEEYRIIKERPVQAYTPGFNASRWLGVGLGLFGAGVVGLALAANTSSGPKPR